MNPSDNYHSNYFYSCLKVYNAAVGITDSDDNNCAAYALVVLFPPRWSRMDGEFILAVAAAGAGAAAGGDFLSDVHFSNLDYKPSLI